MNRIALVGAPNLGKTELAQQLVSALPESKVVVVDDYIAEIEQRLDTKLGHFADYLGNLQVAIGRYELERQLIRDEKPDVLITCGTMIETIVYNGIYALIEHDMDAGKLTALALQNNKRASVLMTLLGIMNYDSWLYNESYYLPLDENYKAQDDSKWSSSVDTHIPEAASALDVKLKTLPEDRQQRIAVVLEDLVAAAIDE